MTDILVVLSAILGVIAAVAVLFYAIVIGITVFVGISEAIKRAVDRDRRQKDRERRERRRR